MGLGLVYGPGAWLVRIKFVFSIIAELKGYLNHYPFPNLMFILFFILPFRQPWDVRSMHFHLLANHWLVGLHRVLSRNAERLVVVMVTLQVLIKVNALLYCKPVKVTVNILNHVFNYLVINEQIMVIFMKYTMTDYYRNNIAPLKPAFSTNISQM